MKKRPKLSRTRQDQAKLRSGKVKKDLLVNTATTSSTAIINRRGNRMQGDSEINRIFHRRRMLLITMVIPLVRSVGTNTREIAVLGLIITFCVARKATMLETAMLTPRIRRTIRKVKGINFMQHR